MDGAASRSLVLVAEPGAGKTTRWGRRLLKAGVVSGENPNIVMLQPRRVAARAAAERIAEENGWRGGEEVGYQIRFERRMTERTRLRVMTEGILTRQFVDDPFLTGVGCVILDEFHERNLNTDVAAALLQGDQGVGAGGPDHCGDVGDVGCGAGGGVFGGDADGEGGGADVSGGGGVSRVGGGGRSDADLGTGGGGGSARSRLPAGDGDVLVFLPGVMEIQRTMELLGGVGEDVRVVPLHGSLTGEEQYAALRPAPVGVRKVICATNIAETSLTIEGVKTVVDGGQARVAVYDPRRGLDRLELKRISKASATQRAGRAGRTGPGRCVRLWGERENAFLEEFEVPEVRRVDLAGTVLALHAWGEDPRGFGWYERPSDAALDAAERLLEMLGALTAERGGKITALGQRILAVPAHPRLGRLMVDAADRGMIDDGATVAAVLSERDFVVSDRWGGAKERGRSDVIKRLELLENRGRGAEVDGQGMRQVERTGEELKRVGEEVASRSEGGIARATEGEMSC